MVSPRAYGKLYWTNCNHIIIVVCVFTKGAYCKNDNIKEIRQAIVLVDAHESPYRNRSTAGRYRVGAKSEKEAEDLVRKAIGFGSVKFYYWTASGTKLPYKMVVKECYDGTTVHYEQPKHACSPRNTEN